MGETFFAKLEALSRWLQLKYMKPRQTIEVVEPGRIRFHPHDCRDGILLKYNHNLKKLGIK